MLKHKTVHNVHHSQIKEAKERYETDGWKFAWETLKEYHCNGIRQADMIFTLVFTKPNKRN